MECATVDKEVCTTMKEQVTYLFIPEGLTYVRTDMNYLKSSCATSKRNIIVSTYSQRRKTDGLTY